MIGLWYGNEVNLKKEPTCDAHRGNEDVPVNSLNTFTISFIKYHSDVAIYSEDENINRDLNSKLN